MSGAPPLLAGSAAVALVCALVILATGRGRRALLPAAAAAAVALWTGAVAVAGGNHPTRLSVVAEALHDLAFLALLLTLSHRFGGRRARGQVWLFALGGTMLAVVAALLERAAPEAGTALLAQLGLALLLVLAAENLYRNAREAARWHVVLPAVAIGGIAAFDMLLLAEAVLTGTAAANRTAARCVLASLAMPLLVLAVLRDRRIGRDPPVSREMVFHGATLVVAGAFLTAVGVMGEALRHLGPDWAPTLRAALFGSAGISLVLALATASFRSRLRRLVVDHFHHSRFDYRREWLRCSGTLSAPDEEMPAEQRAIRAVADAVDSPAGVLLLRAPDGGFEWAGSWNRPARALALPRGHALETLFEDGARIAVLEAEAPHDLDEAFGPLWLGVPLAHHRLGLVGAVLLAPPRAAFPLDREAFDLLRTLGREVAMFLAERSAAERLAEQRRVHAYAQRFAFVAHDVKTVASQLSLLLANAEENIANPEFQRDMLVTVRASAERIRGLIARLPGRDPGPEPAAAPGAPGIDPLERLRALAAAQRHPVRVEVEGGGGALVQMAAEAFDSALGHLIDNAVEASAPGEAVRVRLRQHAARVAIDVTDRGTGMSPEFIRDELFRPLGTTKPEGTGIGTWQARELLREAGGDLTVLSRPGVGTTMRLTLPTRAPGGALALEDRA